VAQVVGQQEELLMDAEKWAALKNELEQHRRTCNRCWQGIFCPEKHRLQVEIETVKTGWKMANRRNDNA